MPDSGTPRAAFRGRALAPYAVLGVAVLAALSPAVLHWGWRELSHGTWINGSAYTLVAFFGAAAAIALAAALLHGHWRADGRIIAVAAGLIAMGLMWIVIVGIAAAMRYQAMAGWHQRAVLQRSLSELIAAGLLAAVWLNPRRLARRPADAWVGGGMAALAATLVTITLPAAWLLGAGLRQFTVLADLAGGVLFLAAAAWFVRKYRETRGDRPYVLACITVLMGVSELASLDAAAWSGVWWADRIIHCAGFALALGFVVRQYGRLVGRLQHALVQQRSIRELLHDREERLRITLGSIGDGVLAVDTDRRITEINEAAVELTGWSAEDAEGKPLSRVFRIIDEGTREPAFNPVTAAMDTGEVQELGNHTLLIRRDGVELNIADSAAPIRDDAGQMVGAVVVFRDVTEQHNHRREREKLLADLTERVKELQCLYKLGKRVETPGITLEDIFRQTVESLPEAWQYPDITAARIVFDGQEYKTGNFRETDWTQSADVVVPDHADGRIDVVYLEPCPDADEGPFLSEERNLLDMLAERLGRITQRNLVAAELRRSEHKFRELFENTADALFIADLEGRFLAVNRVACERLGYARDELVGMRITDVDAEPFGQRVEDLIAEVREKGSAVFETAHVTRDGRVIPTEVSTRLIDYEGSPATFSVARDISRRKRAERKLRENRRYLQGVFDTVATGLLVIDPDDRRILDVNPYAAERLGYRRKQLVGQRCDEKICPGADDDCPACTGADAAEEEAVMRTADGAEMPVLRRVTTLTIEGRECLLDCFVDLTDLKAAEENWRHEAARLSAVISGMDEGVVFADVRGVVTDVNEYFCELMRVRREDVVGRELSEFHSPQTTARLERLVEGFRSDPSKPGVVEQRALGDREMLFRIQPVNRDGKYDGVVLNLVDVTELVEARRAAEGASRAKSAFLANMSHEIRTPLTSILGYADLLPQAGATDDEQREYLDALKRNGRHLLMLINDILDVSKMEAGKLELKDEPFRPPALIADVASMMRVRAEASGLSLGVEYVGALPESIRADETRIRQMLVNLVGNAIKFTEQGGVRIRVLWKDGDDGDRPRLRVEVADTGPGIAPEDLDRLAEPFAQGDPSHSRKHGGTGLGLSICRGLCDLMGGEFLADSTPGEGSAFGFEVPADIEDGARMLADPAEAVGPETPPQDDDVAENALEGVRILLAEDGPDNRRLIGTILARAGADVQYAVNGRDALDKADRDAHDVILMDMQMPEMDGYQVTRKLREDGFDLPIIALTAHALSGDRERCLEAGCSDYLAKPIDRKQTVATVARRARPDGGEGAEASPTDGTTDDSSHAAPARADEDGDEAACDDPILSDYRDDPDIAELLDAFVDGFDGKLRQMRRARENGDFATLRRVAHHLKGAGGSYGYPMLSDAAAGLEQAADDEDVEACGVQLNETARLCARVARGRGFELKEVSPGESPDH